MRIDQAFLLKSLTGIWGKRDKKLSQLLLQTHNAGNCSNQPRGVIVHTPRSNGFMLKSLCKAWKVGLSRNGSNNYTCRKLWKGDYDKDFASIHKALQGHLPQASFEKVDNVPDNLSTPRGQGRIQLLCEGMQSKEDRKSSKESVWQDMCSRGKSANKQIFSPNQWIPLSSMPDAVMISLYSNELLWLEWSL